MDNGSKKLEKLEKKLKELEEIHDFWQEMYDNTLCYGFEYTPDEPTPEEIWIIEAEEKIEKIKKCIKRIKGKNAGGISCGFLFTFWIKD